MKNILVRDLQTNEIKSFEYLKDVADYVGITDLRGRWVERNRLIKGRFIVGYNKESLVKVKNVRAQIKTFYIYDIVDKCVLERTCTREELMKEFNLKKHQLEDCIFKGYLNNKRYGFSFDSDKLDFYLSKIKPPKEPKPRKVRVPKPPKVKAIKPPKPPKIKVQKVVKPKKKPTFVIFDLKNGRTKKIEGSLRNVSQVIDSSVCFISTQMRLKRLIKKQYAVSRTEDDYQYYKDLYSNMSLTMKFKKTNAQRKKQKPDMAFNGEFKKPEPNKQAVRIGKHGVSKIREILGIKDK